MGTSMVIVGLILSVIVLVLCTVKFKIHPFFALIATTVTFAAVSGMNMQDMLSAFTSGMGGTMADIGLVIALGTVTGALLEKSGAAETMAQTILKITGKKHAALGLAIGILAPFVIGFIFRTCVGSATIAMVTAATMISPMLDVLGFASPIGRVIAMLACAAGGLMVFHGNDDFFWVTATTSEMDTSVAYKTIPIISVLQSVTALIVVFVLSVIFL